MNYSIFRFESPDILYLILLLPVFTFLYILSRIIRKRKLLKFGELQLLAELMPEVSRSKHIIKFTLLALSFALLVVGAANPQIGSKTQEIKREGVEAMIAIDVSNSMKAEDLKPNRLERAKQAVSRLIDKLSNDRIGIVVFAGDAYLQLPMTMDYGAAKLLTSTIETDLIPMQGTAIGKAINLASNSFSDDEGISKAIIIISDGENHEDDALGAAKSAAEKGIIIHTIGMGSPAGAPVPIYQQGNLTGYIKDRDGNTVVSKLDPVMLQQIATSASGNFTYASGTDVELSSLLDEIAGMNKTELESKVFTDYDDKFQYFIAFGVLLLLLELFFSERINKHLATMNLFGVDKNAK